MAIKFLKEPGEVSDIEKKDILFEWKTDSYTWQPPMPPSDGKNRLAVMPKPERHPNFSFSVDIFFRFLNQPSFKLEGKVTIGQDKIGGLKPPFFHGNDLIGEASYNLSGTLELLLNGYERVIGITPDQSQVTAEYYIEISESFGTPATVRSSLKSTSKRVTMQLKRSSISTINAAELVLAQQAASLSFSQNEVCFQLRSTTFLDTPPAHYKGEFKLPINWMTTLSGKRRPAYQNANKQTVPLWPDGQPLEFKFSDQSIKLWPVTKPDGSGHQFFEECGSIAQIAPYINANYLLNKHFEVEKKLDCLVFKARQAGHAFNLSGNDFLKSIINGVDRSERANFRFLVEVFFRRADQISFNCVYSAQIAQDSPFSGIASIDVSSIIDAFLEDDVVRIDQPSSPLLCQKSSGDFFVQCAEVYGQPTQVQKVIKSDIKTVIKGGFATRHRPKSLLEWLVPDPSDAQQDRFLKSGGRQQTVHINQPLWLFFVNTRANNKQLRLKKTIEYLDGTSNVCYSTFCDASLFAKICFEVSLEARNITQVLCHLENQDNARASEDFTLFVNHEHFHKCRFFAYISGLGSLETFSTRGEGMQFYDIVNEASESERMWGSKVQIHYNNRLKRTFKVSTGLQEKNEYKQLAEFFLSEKKYIIEHSSLVPIIVVSKKAGNTSDWQRVHMTTFEFQYAAEEIKYSSHD